MLCGLLTGISWNKHSNTEVLSLNKDQFHITEYGLLLKSDVISYLHKENIDIYSIKISYEDKIDLVYDELTYTYLNGHQVKYLLFNKNKVLLPDVITMKVSYNYHSLDGWENRKPCDQIATKTYEMIASKHQFNVCEKHCVNYHKYFLWLKYIGEIKE